MGGVNWPWSVGVFAIELLWLGLDDDGDDDDCRLEPEPELEPAVEFAFKPALFVSPCDFSGPDVPSSPARLSRSSRRLLSFLPVVMVTGQRSLEG